MESFPPCPECRGKRAFFKRNSGIQSSPQSLFSRTIIVYAFICLDCGYTTLRIHPDDMERLRKAAETAEGKALHSCLECGGPQAFFRGIDGFVDSISLGFMKTVGLYTCICLKCGCTTKCPHPDNLEKLREASAKGNTVDL